MYATRIRPRKAKGATAREKLLSAKGQFMLLKV